MAEIAVDVTWKHLSGLPENDVVNTWAFLTPSVGVVDAELNDVWLALRAFYETTYNGHSVSGLFGESITRAGGHTAKFYDLTGHLDGSPHGSPVRVSGMTAIASEVGTELPTEVAICLSFHSGYGTDVEFAPGARPRARDRGRIYLGPLTTSVLNYDSTIGRTFVSSAVRTSIANAAAALRDTAGNAWGVWSRKNARIEPVETAWVDDAFDIQRRRGERPVARTTV